MKKLALSLLACLAIVQSTYAATPALTESLLEYEAIINAIGSPDFTTIGVNEFIIDIKRITCQVNILGIVKYVIKTRVITDSVNSSGDQRAIEMYSAEKNLKNRPQNTNSYIATLLVEPNPGVGPNIVTVLSITPGCTQTQTRNMFNENLPDVME